MRVNTLAQLWGMLRYELLMQWRQGGLGFALGAFLLANVALQVMLHAAYQTVVQRGLVGAGTPAAMGIFTALLLLGVLLPVISAETVPLDRQRGVTELLNALPLPYSVYLLGKVLGVVAGVALGASVVGALVWALTLLLYGGALGAGVFAFVWGVSVVPLAAFLAAFGTLVPSPLPTRRAALLAMLASGVYTFYLFVLLLVSLWRWLGEQDALFSSAFTTGGFGVTSFGEGLLIVGAHLAAAWLLAWGGRRVMNKD